MGYLYNDKENDNEGWGWEGTIATVRVDKDTRAGVRGGAVCARQQLLVNEIEETMTPPRASWCALRPQASLRPHKDELQR